MRLNSTIYIICGVHNQVDKTKKLLASLRVQTYKNFEIIIVDDGSIDGTYDEVKKSYPNVRLLRGDGSLWWTGAIYWGVEEALKNSKEGDFILTINNDCYVKRDYLASILNCSVKGKRVIVGSVIVDSKDEKTIYEAGIKINWERGEFINLKTNSNGGVDTLPTKGTLYPVEVFKEVGNFDKKHFPHYLSDYEFGLRAAKGGFNLTVCERAVVFNEIKNTGLGQNIPSNMGLRNAVNLLFSRRSRVNLFDQVKFILYCCPSEYRIKNIILLAKKLFRYSAKI